jgi:hypothetical protein
MTCLRPRYLSSEHIPLLPLLPRDHCMGSPFWAASDQWLQTVRGLYAHRCCRAVGYVKERVN